MLGLVVTGTLLLLHLRRASPAAHGCIPALPAAGRWHEAARKESCGHGVGADSSRVRQPMREKRRSAPTEAEMPITRAL